MHQFKDRKLEDYARAQAIVDRINREGTPKVESLDDVKATPRRTIRNVPTTPLPHYLPDVFFKEGTNG